ncbi:MAG: alanine--tRNA ligase [Acidobacteria bacterium]|nr:alanine--tRNA ligase [Acidobacteriota bacterium]
MKSKDVREKFLSYFENRDHKRISSASLIPRTDPTLMFTNAGMNQFKNVFLGKEKVDYNRATSCQKCCRVTGKHNDFEMVGKTPRHHTFFEMLGNFSFGNYFKKEAIEFGYELIVKEYGFPLDRLYFTVYKDDDEAYDLWHKHIGIPANRVLRYDEKENFWAMGDTGPCGPCSEIHYDFGPEYSKEIKNPEPANGGDRFIELWNLVFMQFNRTEDGKMEPLAAPSVDTGAGLERLSAVLQGKDNNYHSDLFMPLIEHLSDKAEVEYDADSAEGLALRVMADHIRAATFLISDGLLPSNEGRGYVLRRILRRGIRFAKKIGVEEPLLFESSGFVVSQMKDQYIELEQSRDFVARVIKSEEERFNSTIAYGMNYFKELIESPSIKKSTVVPGTEVFKLYDTFGLPLDFTKDMADEWGFQVDEKGFEAEMEKQRERARSSWKGSGAAAVDDLYIQLGNEFNSEFTGYTETESQGLQVLALIKDGSRVEKLLENEEGEIILDKTPFYGESGGQVGDQGKLSALEFEARVNNTVKPVASLFIHKVKIEKGTVKTGDILNAEVDAERRKNIMRNHTATHLLQAALRNELGMHVKQAGSLVEPDRFRFDFTHFSQVGPRELRRIEHFVNDKILQNREVSWKYTTLDGAIAEGAIALFDEKYGDEVRLITVDSVSKELCGGTHVNRTGDIGLFRIVSESSIAAGVRRIEALTGWGALNKAEATDYMIEETAKKMKTSVDELPHIIDKLLEKNKKQEKEIKDLQMKLAEGGSASDSDGEVKEVNGVKVFINRLDHLDAGGLRDFSDRLKNKHKSCIIILGASKGDKALMVASVSKDLSSKIDAVSLINKVSKAIEGGGGGRPDMAQAGGKKPENLDLALKNSEKIIEEEIKRAT